MNLQGTPAVGSNAHCFQLLVDLHRVFKVLHKLEEALQWQVCGGIAVQPSSTPTCATMAPYVNAMNSAFCGET